MRSLACLIALLLVALPAVAQDKKEVDLALAMAFGALIGWLGAWSLLRFRPPREPEA